MATRPTERQLETLRVIASHMYETGVAPTVREIGAALGGIGPNAVASLLWPLEREGLIETGRNAKRRSLRITAEGLRLLGIGCAYCEEVSHG